MEYYNDFLTLPMTPFSNKQKILLATGLLLALIQIITLIWWQNKQPIVVHTSCQITQQGCPFLNGAILYLLDVQDNKSPFNIAAHHVPEHVQQLSVSFLMENMDMGFNRIDLKKSGSGMWSAKNVYLPFCTSARDDWIIQWHADGQTFETKFHTQSSRPNPKSNAKK